MSFKKEENQKSDGSSLLAVGLGALLGGAVVGLATYLFSDKEERQPEQHRHFQQDRTEPCSICLEGSVVLPCGHSFHEQCAIKNFENHKQCPLCRRTYTTEEIRRIREQCNC